MYCKNCGEQMDDKAAVCVKCGVKAGDGNSFCANCGSAMAAGAAFCTNCGSAPKAANQYGDYDKTVLGLIALFLGGLGIHCFMLGEVKKGIVRIALTCCCGIGQIIAIIDCVRIFTDSYTVDPEGWF